MASNIFLGIFLAIGILWWFLRRLRATLIIAIAIPISLLATFIVLNTAGRSLNVISLRAGVCRGHGAGRGHRGAGEHRAPAEKGLTSTEAALLGSSQVWGALLASTATTVAIFLPVLFMREVEGQLFADLAITIAIAVIVSTVVAVTIIPLAAGTWLHGASLQDHNQALWQRITGLIMAITATAPRRWALVVSMVSLPLVLSVALLPELDYLPPVKRDAVDAYFWFPRAPVSTPSPVNTCRCWTSDWRPI